MSYCPEYPGRFRLNSESPAKERRKNRGVPWILALLTMDQEQFAIVRKDCRRQGAAGPLRKEVAAAVNGAGDGQVISGSEMRVREVMVEPCKAKVFETAVQMRIDSTESSFSPSEGRRGQEQAEQGEKQSQHVERERPDRSEPGALVRGRRRQ